MQLPSLFDLTGRVALVTGASSGLGVQFAEALLDAGATVVLAARRTNRLEAIAKTSERYDQVTCDIADGDSIDAAVDAVLERHQAIDILVNNAGTTWAGRAENEPPTVFRTVVDTNLTGAFHLTQRVVRQMLERRRGSIVNVSSVHGLVAAAPNGQASYCASKSAMLGLTRELAVQWADRGVRVNAIAPGYFRSELTDALLADEKGLSYVTAGTPMQRPGEPGELTGALLLLASDAGSYITGQVLAVDGGWTAR